MKRILKGMAIGALSTGLIISMVTIAQDTPVEAAGQTPPMGSYHYMMQQQVNVDEVVPPYHRHGPGMMDDYRHMGYGPGMMMYRYGYMHGPAMMFGNHGMTGQEGWSPGARWNNHPHHQQFHRSYENNFPRYDEDQQNDFERGHPGMGRHMMPHGRYDGK